MFSGLCVFGVRMNVETNINTSSVFFLLIHLLLFMLALRPALLSNKGPHDLLCCFSQCFPRYQKSFKAFGFEKNKPKHCLKLIHGMSKKNKKMKSHSQSLSFTIHNHRPLEIL